MPALSNAMPQDGAAGQPRCVDIEGFSLHGAVPVKAHRRNRLQQLCRHITRPALCHERSHSIFAPTVGTKLTKREARKPPDMAVSNWPKPALPNVS